jgi:hypothetical protein
MSKTTPPKARQAKKKSSASNGETMKKASLHPIESEHEAKQQGLPSRLQLTTLAAALYSPEDTPDTTAARALAVWEALWEACGKTIVVKEMQYAKEFLTKAKAKLLGIDEAVMIGEWGEVKDVDEAAKIPLEHFQKLHFSKNSKKETKQKKFRDFLRDSLSFWSSDPNFNPDDLDPEERERLELDGVATLMQRYREQGVAAHEAIYLFDEFEEFLERTNPEIRKLRGSKGGIGKRDKAQAALKAAEAEAAAERAKKPSPKSDGRKKRLEAKATAPSKRRPGASIKA